MKLPVSYDQVETRIMLMFLDSNHYFSFAKPAKALPLIHFWLYWKRKGGGRTHENGLKSDGPFFHFYFVSYNMRCITHIVRYDMGEMAMTCGYITSWPYHQTLPVPYDMDNSWHNYHKKYYISVSLFEWVGQMKRKLVFVIF